jgi:hypothetical protein
LHWRSEYLKQKNPEPGTFGIFREGTKKMKEEADLGQNFPADPKQDRKIKQQLEI